MGWPVAGGRGGEQSLQWPIRGGSDRKRCLFQATGTSKGREICERAHRAEQMNFMVIKSGKRPIFVIDSYLNERHLHKLKGMQSSKQGM